MNLMYLKIHKEFRRIQKQCKNTFLVNISFPGQKEGKNFFSPRAKNPIFARGEK